MRTPRFLDVAPALKELNACADTLDALACAADSYGLENYGPVSGDALRLVRDLMQDRLSEIRAAFPEAHETREAGREVPVMATKCGEFRL
jgi:hypothetical protein